MRRIGRSLAILGRDANATQIALGLGISEEQWREWDAIDSNIAISLDELIIEPAQADEDIEADLLMHLTKLRSQQRTAIVEKFFNNSSIRDIAKKQKTSPEFIRASINLGLAKLRISLSKEQ